MTDGRSAAKRAEADAKWRVALFTPIRRGETRSVSVEDDDLEWTGRAAHAPRWARMSREWAAFYRALAAVLPDLPRLFSPDELLVLAEFLLMWAPEESRHGAPWTDGGLAGSRRMIPVLLHRAAESEAQARRLDAEAKRGRGGGGRSKAGSVRAARRRDGVLRMLVLCIMDELPPRHQPLDPAGVARELACRFTYRDEAARREFIKLVTRTLKHTRARSRQKRAEELLRELLPGMSALDAEDVPNIAAAANLSDERWAYVMRGLRRRTRFIYGPSLFSRPGKPVV